MSRVGMVVPTLGERPEMLAQCVRSIQGQSSVRVEPVLVTTGDAAAGIAEAFPHLPVIPQRGRGIAAAITTGWQYLGDRVDALAWLGDDDRLPPGSLAAALAALDRCPRTVLVYGRSRYIDAAGSPRWVLRPGRLGAAMLRLGHNLVLQPGCVYRRSAVETIGGLDHSLALAFDVDLHRRLIAHGRARYVPVVLGEVRSHPDSLTVRQSQDSRREADLALASQMPRWMLRARPLWHPASELLVRAAVRISSP